MGALVFIVFLLALGACVWLFVASCRLMIRSAQRMFTPAPAPTFGPPPAEPVVPPEHVVPGWTAKLVGDHLARCQRCRDDYVSGTLPLLEPSTISRVLALVEDHEPVTP